MRNFEIPIRSGYFNKTTEEPIMNTTLLIHRFTVNEYHRMGKTGIFREDNRVELIEGRIVDMTPIGSRHASCVDRLNNFFTIKLQKRVIVRVQNPIQLDNLSEPQPDIMLLKYKSDFYAAHHPRPEDVLLLVEVAESSIEYERNVKIPMYARSNIQEVWLVNLAENYVEIYHSPSSEGYELTIQCRHKQKVTPKNFPEAELTASEILGSLAINTI